MSNIKKICVFTGYRSDYTKLKTVLDEIKKSPCLDLNIVSIGAHNLNDYDNTKNIITSDGFEVCEHLNTNVEGDTTESMVMSMGLSMLQLGRVLNKIKPDAVMIVGDRYEMIPVALSSTSMNIPVCHIQGGEISGTIDEVYRHVITKLSHVHFPSTEKSKNRILMMGENKNFVFNVGCPAIDYIKSITFKSKQDIKNLKGLSNLKVSDDYILFMQHPVTTEPDSYNQMRNSLLALQKYGKKVILIYPNPDPGSDQMIRAIRDHEKNYGKESVIKNKFKNLNFDSFMNLLHHSDCLVGNSSCGIREAYALNKYVIDIGTRQNNRERSKNVINTSYDSEDIFFALSQIKFYSTLSEVDQIYGSGNASKKITRILEKINFNNAIDKRLSYDI